MMPKEGVNYAGSAEQVQDIFDSPVFNSPGCSSLVIFSRAGWTEGAVEGRFCFYEVYRICDKQGEVVLVAAGNDKR